MSVDERGYQSVFGSQNNVCIHFHLILLSEAQLEIPTWNDSERGRNER